jgi:hypothetical protein
MCSEVKKKRFGFVCCVAALLVCVAHAQSDDHLAMALEQGSAEAQTLANALPSFTCAESGASDILRASDSKMEKHVAFTGNVRAVRTAQDPDLKETVTFDTLNGKQAKKNATLPYEVHDTFTKGLTYLDAGTQHCYDYSLAPNADGTSKLSFKASQPFDRFCNNLPGTVGYATIDATGNITHLERRIPDLLATEADLVPYAAIDFAPVDLGGKTYRLASHSLSERQDGKELRRIDVSYSNCKLFRTEIKLLPDTEPVPDDTPSPAAKP